VLNLVAVKSRSLFDLFEVVKMKFTKAIKQIV